MVHLRTFCLVKHPYSPFFDRLYSISLSPCKKYTINSKTLARKHFILLHVAQIYWNTVPLFDDHWKNEESVQKKEFFAIMWQTSIQFALIIKAESVFVITFVQTNLWKLQTNECIRSWKFVTPPPEGLCQPSTPPLSRCLADARPASPWTQPENPAHCCYGRWGWRWFLSPQRPALHGGTSHLNKEYDNYIYSVKTIVLNKNWSGFLLQMSTCDVKICLDSIQHRGPRSSTNGHSTHRRLWEISE